MDVEIKQMPALRAAGLRHLGAYEEIGEAFDRLHALVGSGDAVAGGQAKLLAIYHDDPEVTPQPELRSDAALLLPPEVPSIEGLREQRLAAGRYACARHHGSYRGLRGAWAELLGEWLPLNGERWGLGPCYEVYLNTPMDTAEDDLRTELYVPLG